ncbi:NADH-ubiquinone oxidoreductase 17.8 kDa subunit [Colletotrichum paranaense]|uniref:NADH-ubiquinone oxidoreductase 17.8 kDa subunit n=9 Tax=Colletotrichum acutatum species complex TaxID=2707335 RepID=A0A9P7UJF1_9PEZI|nr:NADH-ubiquinone oxidoreductase 17.8 kDa subunit [Colletotrichum scovillei]XP_060305332.1 NADH-ubiquinone oxidoreductase 17.8 kDa subunit [Colletotrichum costaricense]XP_060351031.1 NADH-ubiquinone oxidoreductase 17.8 kDa subunit [Colletotrichum paranaense]XP_060381490.1 NADH-ubiquinone oxidoreductase 17.8 kDa subunit [Colletotrichum tamarilloi]XP_060396359.1 NADH-ubiquinone oxidoreductase 17.8 kDa subunit [Colletotrichum abscissum]KAI3545889.1 NADH-ubiquinone oxidoreductase 17.8 kDa subunit
MQAIRTRAVCIARQSRLTGLRQSRTYASGGDHGHHHAHTVEEPIGNFFWAVVAIIPSAYAVYKITAPGKDGEPPYLTQKIHEAWHWQETWKERNALHTKAVEQAGFDRLLFFSTPANRDVDLRFPEAVSNFAARNVIAGSQTNLDHVIAHYKKQHLDEEERKAKKLAAQKQE